MWMLFFVSQTELIYVNWVSIPTLFFLLKPLDGSREKMQTFMLNGSEFTASNSVNGSVSARNLTKSHLGGVIFGCKDSTIKECLFKQLFGLPAQHFSYVKKIDPGLPLFLFNYSDRKLHGIFEAASSGQHNIDPYGWTIDGSQRTLYPAQVQIRVRLQCQPLLENQFKPIIEDNYYNRNHFWFELDHAQTSKLISLLASLAVAPRAPVPQQTAMWRSMFRAMPSPDAREEYEGFVGLDLDFEHSTESSRKLERLEEDSRPLRAHLDTEVTEQEQLELAYKKLKELVSKHEYKDLYVANYLEDTAGTNELNCQEPSFVEAQIDLRDKIEESPSSSSDYRSVIAQLIQGLEEQKAFRAEQTQKISCLEQKLVEAEIEIQQLKNRCARLESESDPTMACAQTVIESFAELHLDPTNSIYLVGGYDGESWLSALDSYFPCQGVIKSLRQMNSVCSYASVAQLNGELYVLGGGNGYLWCKTVESYDPAIDQWTSRPSLNENKGSLGAATLNDKIFAIGGGNGVDCFSDVEMLDLDIGRWIRTRSMLHKRFALAAAELNGVLYATGGYDGKDYLMSVERFDPREHYWTKIASMNTKRGCHSLVVLNDKLYALGGFDGSTMVSTVEVYDPRLESWMTGEPMNHSRGYFGAAVINKSIYVIGGVKVSDKIVDTIEQYNEDQGWQEISNGSIGKRCFLSAITL